MPAVADGHQFANDDGRTFFHVINGNASPLTVIIQTTAVVDGLAVADRTVVVPAGEERIIGPFPPEWYNHADGKVYVDYDITPSVTAAAIHLPDRRVRSAYTLYVDSVNGDDANSGISPDRPLATLSAAEALLADDVVVMLARGSTWREQLTIAQDGVTVAAYGSGARPVLDCSTPQANGSFTKTVGRTNVYQVDVVTNYQAGHQGFIRVWEDDISLIIAADLAGCDATPGSYYVADHQQANITVYVHASDGSSIISNGKTYDVAVRQSGVFAYDAAKTSIVGLHCRRNYGLGGSVKAGPYTELVDCIFEDGNQHNCYVGAGSNVIGCTFVDAYWNSTATMLVINENTPNGEDSLIKNCTFKFSDYNAPRNPNTGYANCHHNVSSNFGTITVQGCKFQDLACVRPGEFNHADTVVFENCTWIDCAAMFCTMQSPLTLRKCTFSSIRTGIYAANIDIDHGFAISIEGCIFAISGSTTNGIIRIIGPLTVKMTDCIFVNNTAEVLSNAIYSQSAGATLDLSNCTFKGSRNWQFIYRFVTAGFTWSSDYNAFGPNFLTSIFGSTYNSLAAHQFGTGQDLNGTGP